MSQECLILSDKYKDFLRHNAPMEVLEGTTAAGKTTVGIFKFMLMVAQSYKKYHIVAAADIGTAEKNFINKDLGIVDDFGNLVEYNGNGTKDEKIPHIRFQTNSGDKIIYVMGYGNREKWKKALGGQYGCLYIDEANTADIEFVREATMRADYVMMTLNPDDPNLTIYKEYINCCRPLTQYENDTPAEIRRMLTEEPKPGWTYWFFSFNHNAALSEKKLQQIKLSVPKGTKLWKNKIIGVRGRATGLVFGLFERKRHVITIEQAKTFIYQNSSQQEYFEIFTAGLDTAYSSQSPDTIAMSFAGITNRGKCIVLNERVYNNADISQRIAPSDTVTNFVDFLNRNSREWGLARNTFVDSADQATISEFEKYKRYHPECMYIFNNAYKKIKNIDRINLQLDWMSYDDEHGKTPCFFVVDTCPHYIAEMEVYSWQDNKDNTPEDGNDHMIQSGQYGWIPYRDKIYRKEER
ncbi:MAG: terminase [Lachnospiraceae bacterium]